MPENILEACTKLQEDAERFIRLSIARQDPYLHITCVNSRQREIIGLGGRLQTTKPDSAGHGYGLWTIEPLLKLMKA